MCAIQFESLRNALGQAANWALEQSHAERFIIELGERGESFRFREDARFLDDLQETTFFHELEERLNAGGVQNAIGLLEGDAFEEVTTAGELLAYIDSQYSEPAAA